MSDPSRGQGPSEEEVKGAAEMETATEGKSEELTLRDKAFNLVNDCIEQIRVCNKEHDDLDESGADVESECDDILWRKAEAVTSAYKKIRDLGDPAELLGKSNDYELRIIVDEMVELLQDDYLLRCSRSNTSFIDWAEEVIKEKAAK